MDNEKIYKVMNSSGVFGVTLGIVMLVAGAVCGIINIVVGARLLKKKSDIMF